jgi:hypothetical protein
MEVTIMADIQTTGYSDNTAKRLSAYLGSVRAIDDCNGTRYARGSAAIGRLIADAYEDHHPTLELSREECADLLYFVTHSQPRDPATWWTDPEDAPSHVVGWMFALGAAEDSLRNIAEGH